MVQSQSVRLQMWCRTVDEDGVKRCEEHTVTSCSSNTDAARYAYIEAIAVTNVVTLLQLLPGFDYMGASHLHVTYTIQQGETAHQSINFVKAGDKVFNTYVFRPQPEEQVNPTNPRQTTDQSHQTEHTFGVEVTIIRGFLSGVKFRPASDVAGRPIRLVLHHANRSKMIALGIVEAETPVPNELEEAEVQADVAPRTDHSSSD